MKLSDLKNSFTPLKVALLTGLVIVSFVLSSFGHRHVEVTQSSRIIVAAVILVTMYALMIFELVNRNLAALIGAALSIAAYDCLVEFAGMEEIIQWLDLETLSLLFGMMIIVNVLSDSGIFEYMAIWSYEKSQGRFWTLITMMAFVTGILSAFIDNVSTMLLMSPTIIKLSALEQIDPRPILMMMVVFSNIGGCATPVGDPPNLIIIGDSLVNSLGISFGVFTAYCAPCVMICMVATLIYMKLVYKSKERIRVLPPRKSISMRNQSFDQRQMHATSVLVDMKKKLDDLDGCLTQASMETRRQIKDLTKIYGTVMKQVELETQIEGHSALTGLQTPDMVSGFCKIRSKQLLIQSSVVLLVAILLFFFQSSPDVNLTLGWVSLYAGLTILVLSSSTRVPNGELESGEEEEDDEEEDSFDRIVSRVEWPTLIFFFALFIVMEVMSELGLIGFIGHKIGDLVEHIPSGHWRSIGAITIILWSSGIASAMIDNVPFTSMMIKVVGTLFIHARDAGSGTFRLEPLVFALSFGACLGGNGTLIGASANLVTAGIASRHGHKITFNKFFKFAAPITIITLLIANVYLVVVFVALGL